MEKLTQPVAVLAGTPVDTQMGAEVLRAHGVTPMLFPLSKTPPEQAYFQVQPQEEKQARVRGILKEAMERGCGSAFVYCNSLSGSVDFPPLSEELGLRIVTPMDAYGSIAEKHRKLAVIAYSAQAMVGQDRAMMRANPDIILMTAGVSRVAIDIEAGYPPEEILRRNHLDLLLRYFEACGCEALVLGCTHFPYVSGALRKSTTLPLIDPAEDMVRLLLA